MTPAEAVVDYGERGWLVFPQRPRGKVPAIPKDAGGNGLYDATADTARLSSWWARHPDHNIGLRTGLSFDALDVDGPEGLAALDEACDGRESVYGPTVATGGGGFHCYVAVTGLGNRTRFIPGCDWKGANGAVTAPASVHENGTTYRWLDGFGPDHPILPAPAWLLELVRRRPVVPPVQVPQTGGNHDRYGRRALEGEVARVVLAEVGQRNDTLNRAAMSLGQLVGAGVLDAAVVIEHLHVAGIRAGLNPLEVERTITSGMRAGLRNPRRLAS